METLDCGHTPTTDQRKSAPYQPVGYGTDSEGKRYCYACCADRDRASMIETGRAVLYFEDQPKPEVTNWPGSLRFDCTSVRRSERVGFFGVVFPREDFYFVGPDRHIWHGFRQGNSTQLAYCRRTKQTV